MKLKTFLIIGIIAFLAMGIASCAATTKYGCPPAKQGARHDKNLRF